MENINSAEQFARYIWKNYFIERNYALLEDVVDERISVIGTGYHEFSRNLTEFVEKTMKEADSYIGNFSMFNDWYQTTPLSENIFLVIGEAEVKENKRHEDNILYEFKFRFSMIVEQKDNHWSILHVHQSVGDINQNEDEFFPQKITEQSNRILKKTILEKTKEIEKRTEQAIYYSKYDYLTGLANRHHCEKQIMERLANHSTGATVMLDVDDFKIYNDTLGHPFGDRILKLLSNCMMHCFPNDVTGRIGGDEFIMYFVDEENIETKLQEFLQMWKNKQQELELDSYISLSIGIAYYPEHGEDFETLWNNADKALYQVKKKNKNGICIYERESK